MDAAHTHKPLGELLVEEGLLTQEQLTAALAESKESGKRLGQVLVARGLISGPAIANALADQAGAIVRTEYGIATGFRSLRPVPDPPAAQPEPAEPGRAALEQELDERARQLARALEALAEKDRQLAALSAALEGARAEAAALRQALSAPA